MEKHIEKLLEARALVGETVGVVATSPSDVWVPGTRGRVAQLVTEALNALDEACSASGANEEAHIEGEEDEGA